MIRAAVVMLAASILAGCQAEHPPHGEVRREIRPTDGTGWQGNGYGAVTVLEWDTPGGKFRMHYTMEGKHAVAPADTDGSGAPDFVESFGKTFDQVFEAVVQTRGFRPPLDDSIYHDRPDFGGDGRFDVYLQDQGAGADGYFVEEACRTTTPEQCAGYMVVENDFIGYSYPTPRDGMKVLSSHEFFHAIQGAYRSNLPRGFGEGTAVWVTEQVFPEQSDFEHMIGSFLSAPQRSLDDESGGPADLFVYGVALWPTFLTEKHGDKMVPALLEELSEKGTSSSPLDAADLVLKRDKQSSLASAFATFALWNYLTGDRAVAGNGYRAAAGMPQVPVKEVSGPLPQRIAGEIAYLSAQYFRLTVPAGRRVRVAVERAQPELALHLLSGPRQQPKIASIMPPQTSVSVDSSGEVVIVAASTARQNRFLPLSLAVTEEQGVPPPPGSDQQPPDGGVSPEQGTDQPEAPEDGGCALAPPGSPRLVLLWALLGAALLIARRRR